jgi:hypothetical protein
VSASMSTWSAVCSPFTPSGISFCVDKECYCQMTNPYSGQKVLLATHSSGNNCTASCMVGCGVCMKNGSDNSCTRAKLLVPGA